MLKAHLRKKWPVLIILLIIVLIFVAVFFIQQDKDNSHTKKATETLKGRINITLPFTSQNSDWEYVAVDKNINFDIKEGFSKIDSPHLYMNISTVDEYPCMNMIIEGGSYGINRDVYFENNKLTIDLLGVDKRAITECTYATPDIGKFNFQLPIIMRGPGNYIIEFKSQNVIDTYEMVVSKEKIVIEPKEQNFSNPTLQIIERLPEHLLWAQCSYEWRLNHPKDNKCPTFFNNIEALSQPYLDSNKDKILQLQYYIYEGDNETLLSLATQYDPEKYYIEINRWNGDSIRNKLIRYSNSYFGQSYYPQSIETQYAKEFNDTSQCDVTLSKVEYYNCMQNVALYTRNETICGQAAYDPDKCYNDIGMAILNESLCTRLADWKNYYKACYTYIAAHKQDPTICENLEFATDKGNCYESYAVYTNDETFCEKAQFKDRCYRSLAAIRLDITLCDKTEDCISCVRGCFSDIAIKTDEPLDCDALTTNKDLCLEYNEKFNKSD